MESFKKSSIQEERFNSQMVSQSNTTTPSTSGPSATANEAGVSTSASGGISGSSSGEHFASSKSNIKASTPAMGDAKYKRPIAPKINITSASDPSKRSAMKERSIFATPSTLTSTPSSTGTGKGTDPGVQRPCQEHSFLTDVEQVRQMEQGLLQLLDDFHSGHLQAFSNDSVFDQMDQVREQQETLARLHFELDAKAEMSQGLKDAEAREEANKNLANLMENLTELCVSIQSVQENDEPSSTQEEKTAH